MQNGKVNQKNYSMLTLAIQAETTVSCLPFPPLTKTHFFFNPTVNIIHMKTVHSWKWRYLWLTSFRLYDDHLQPPTGPNLTTTGAWDNSWECVTLRYIILALPSGIQSWNYENKSNTHPLIWLRLWIIISIEHQQSITLNSIGLL